MMNWFCKLLGKTAAISDDLPKMRHHVSDTLIGYHENHLTGVICFGGLVFESIADKVLQNDFDALSLLYAEIAKEKSGRLLMNAYQLRRKIDVQTRYVFNNQFCQDFADKYLKRFNDKDYYENRYYLALTLKHDKTALEDAIDELDGIMARLVKTLSKYEPRPLQVYQNKHGVLCSEVVDFFFELLNADAPLAPQPLTQSPIYETLPAASLHFGFEILQIKSETKTRFAALCDLKDYPNVTTLGMFNSASLALPFEFNLIQSFASISSAKALEHIDQKLNQLHSVGDRAEHQQLELVQAQGFVQSGEIALGHYHAALICYGDTQKDAAGNALSAMASFGNNAGAIFRKSTVSAPATYFSQFPTFRHIPRKMVKSTRNLAATFSMHNYSRGKAQGNPLGDGSAVMPLETRSKTLYDFNFHFTNVLENAMGDAIAGHTLILGATGTGKTTLQASLVAFVQRFDPAMFVLDKDRGMDILIRALDGDYFAIEEGKPTGLNPFQFEDTPALREFLNDLVISCARDETEPTSEEQNQIKNAIDAVMRLPVSVRRFGAILQSIPDRGGNSLHQRLLKWCDTEENTGRFAWCLDNPTNQFDPDAFKIVGFECGAILRENYRPTEPLLACLLYLKARMTKKHALLMTIIEEFWLPLMYQTPQMMMLDVLKTGRKRGEFMVMVTQSPEEAVASPIFPAIVQQTPTKILLPNPDAEYKNDQGGGYSRIGLSEKEFKGVQGLALDSRTFLIKQGHQSSFSTLDLYGFGDEISVLSSTKENVELLDEILAHFDVIPPSAIWLPIFYEARAAKKAGRLDIPNLIQNHA